jgi:hypothetical protein
VCSVNGSAEMIILKENTLISIGVSSITAIYIGMSSRTLKDLHQCTKSKSTKYDIV